MQIEAIVAVEQKWYQKCPNCDEVYLQGEAYIAVLFEGGVQTVVGQTSDEMHVCEHCRQEIRGGFENIALIKLFASLEEAQKRVIEIATILFTDIKRFRDEVPLIDIGTMDVEGIRFQ